jgi:capsular exopolysaccharide synthesis family protein
VILLVAGLCLALAGVYLLLSPPLYEATTQLLVRQGKGMPGGAGGADAGQAPEGSGLPEDFVPTQIDIVGSPEVIKRAIVKVGLDNLPTLKRSVRGGRDPAHVAIKKYLKVSQPHKQANVIQIKYRASSDEGEEAVRMLEAITDSYRQFLAEHSERIAVVNKVRSELEGERTLLKARQERLDRARTELRVREVQLQVQVELVQKLTREKTDLWAIAYSMGRLAGDLGDKNGLLAYSSNMAQMTSQDLVKQLRLEQQQLAERYSPQYSKVLEIQGQIDRIQERTRKLEQPDMKDLLQALEGGLKASEAMRAELDKEFEADKARERDFNEEARLRDEVESRRKLFNAADDQLESINAQALEPPNVPERRFWRLCLPVPLLASLFGLAAGAALVLAREELRPRLRSEAEVRKALGLAVVGRLPPLEGSPTVRAGLAAGTPDGQRDRASLHTSLELLRRCQPGLKVLMIAGPRAGAGATLTASNLAVSLAHAGQRTLLIDADLRQSSLAKLHALTTDRGLSLALRGERPVAKVIQRCPVEKLDAIAAGPEVLNSTELLLSPCHPNVLAEVRTLYDTVIVDSPAVLEGPEACILAFLVDGVVLVVRDGVTARADAEEAVRLLRKAKAPLLGAVINDTQGPEIGEADRIADLIADFLARVDSHEAGTNPGAPAEDDCRACEVVRNGEGDR